MGVVLAVLTAAARAGLAVLPRALRRLARLLVPTTEQPANGLPDRRADATRLTGMAGMILLAPMLTAILVTRLPIAALATGQSAVLVSHLAAHAGRSTADVGHSATVAATHRTALMLTRVLLATLLAGLCVDAIALTTIILLAGPATHRLPIALTVATRAILPAVAAAASVVGARILAISACRLPIARLAVRLLGLIAALALAILLALLIASLLAVLLRLVAIFVAVVVATLAVTSLMVRHRWSSIC